MEYYEAAAKWWTDKLRNVTPEHFSSNGRVGSMEKLLASYFPHMDDLSDEDLDLFEKKLADIIKDQVERIGYMILLTHYNPDVSLIGDIARESGIDTDRIPHETTMWIYKEKVYVQYGTDKNFSKIFHK